MPKPGTKQESPISASAQAKATLSRMAAELGVRKIDLLDQAVKALCDYYEFHGKRLLLPLRFTETFQIHKIEPGGTMILEIPPPHARSELDDVADSGRTSGSTRRRAVSA